MSELIRFGISMSEELLESFDTKIVSPSYKNRSEAIRDLIRNRLVDFSWQDENQEVVGTLTLVYDHHVRGLSNLLTEMQHTWHNLILSSMHIHLDHNNCLEVLVIKGAAGQARRVAEELIGVRGVKHGKLSITSSGEELS